MGHLPAVAVLGLLLAAAGCVGPGMPSPKGPDVSAPAHRLPTANLTDCRGSLATFVVPVSLVADDLPPGFEMRSWSAAPPLTNLFLELHACAKIAVDGEDRGAGSLAFLEVPIHAPPGSPTGSAACYFVLELRTNNTALASSSRKHGIDVQDGEVVHSVAGMLPYYAEAHSRLAVDGRTVYEVTGAAEANLESKQEPRRLFLASGDGWAAINEEVAWSDSTHEGPFQFSSAADSRLAQVLAPGAAVSRTLSVQNTTSRQWIFPDVDP
jgi:hypothetical protein